MSLKDAFDCQSCGACCHNMDYNVKRDLEDYVEVNVRSGLLEDDETARKYTFVRKGKHYMRMVGPQPRCIALEGTLGKRVACTVYESRPTPCRKVQSGSHECLARRRERGLPTKP